MKKGLLRVLVLAALTGTAVFATSITPAEANAEAPNPAQDFVAKEHTKLEGLLKQPASVSRDSQVNTALDGMVDYDELTRRAFGKPCPPGISECKNWWDTYSKADQAELTTLLKRLVERNYRKNLQKTLNYDISYRRVAQNGNESRVITEAKAKDKPREPPVRVDYVVLPNSAGKNLVVDIYTENSSLTKNYYQDFNKMMLNPTQGLAHVKKRLIEKGNAP